MSWCFDQFSNKENEKANNHNSVFPLFLSTFAQPIVQNDWTAWCATLSIGMHSTALFLHCSLAIFPIWAYEKRMAQKKWLAAFMPKAISRLHDAHIKHYNSMRCDELAVYFNLKWIDNQMMMNIYNKFCDLVALLMCASSCLLLFFFSFVRCLLLGHFSLCSPRDGCVAEWQRRIDVVEIWSDVFETV